MWTDDPAVLAALEAALAAESTPAAAEPKRKKRKAVADRGGGGGGGSGSSGGGGSGGGSSRERALLSMLHRSSGYPLAVDAPTFSLSGKRLRDATTLACPGDSVLGGAYWIHRDAAAAVLAREGAALLPPPAAAKRLKDVPLWAQQQPWFPQLNVQQRTTRPNGKPPPPYPLWYTHPDPAKRADWIAVPAFFGLSHFGAPQRDLRKLGEPLNPSLVLDPTRPPRSEQTTACGALYTSLLLRGGGFVEADCSFGKTLCMLLVGLQLGRKLALVISQTMLMRQLRFDILGKLWTWANGALIDLTPSGGVKGARVCALSGVDISACTPDKLVRANCVPAAAGAGAGSSAGVEAEAVVVAAPKKRKKECYRLVTLDAYDAWVAQPAATRGKRAADLPCERCGGYFGSVRSFELPSAPKRGWIPNARVGWLQGAYLDKKGRVSKRCDVMDKDIVLVSAASAAQCDYPWASFGFGTVGFDEAHKVATRSNSRVPSELAVAYKFGFTATPQRDDGTTHTLYWLLGPTVYVYHRTAEVTGVVGAVHVRQVVYTGGDREELRYRNGELAMSRMIGRMVEDEARNRLLLDLVDHALRAEGRRKVLLITAYRVHTELLRIGLKARGITDTAVLRSGVTEQDIACAANPRIRVIVATYEYLKEGYDNVDIDTVVLCTPRKRVQQSVGRCERTKEGKLTPVVYDVVDLYSIYEGMSWKRVAFYRSRSFDIKTVQDTECAAVMAATSGAGAGVGAGAGAGSGAGGSLMLAALKALSGGTVRWYDEDGGVSDEEDEDNGEDGGSEDEVDEDDW